MHITINGSFFIFEFHYLWGNKIFNIYIYLSNEEKNC